jgi:iron complex transport system substrate-binding protein
MGLDRRALLTRASAALLAPRRAPAAIMLYTLAPELLLGWPRANRPEEREFLLPDIGARPEVGRITGRGNTANPVQKRAAPEAEERAA